MGVYYEGMAQEWFPIVGIFILTADVSFIVSTMINLIYFRKEKPLVMFGLISLAMIITAIVMKVRGMEYPIWSLTVWNFYIWFYYGYLVVKGCWRRKRKRIFAK